MSGKTLTVLTLSQGLHFPLGPSSVDLTARKRPGPGSPETSF